MFLQISIKLWRFKVDDTEKKFGTPVRKFNVYHANQIKIPKLTLHPCTYIIDQGKLGGPVALFEKTQL